MQSPESDLLPPSCKCTKLITKLWWAVGRYFVNDCIYTIMENHVDHYCKYIPVFTNCKRLWGVVRRLNIQRIRINGLAMRALMRLRILFCQYDRIFRFGSSLAIKARFWVKVIHTCTHDLDHFCPNVLLVTQGSLAVVNTCLKMQANSGTSCQLSMWTCWPKVFGIDF